MVSVTEERVAVVESDSDGGNDCGEGSFGGGGLNLVHSVTWLCYKVPWHQKISELRAHVMGGKRHTSSSIA